MYYINWENGARRQFGNIATGIDQYALFIYGKVESYYLVLRWKKRIAKHPMGFFIYVWWVVDK